MRFRMFPLVAVILIYVTACDWDDKYMALNCAAGTAANQVDCRTDDNSGTGDGLEPALPPDSSGDGVLDFSRDVSGLLQMQQSGSVSWSPHHEDETDSFLHGFGSNLIVGSIYHNRLRSFETDSAGQVVQLGDVPYIAVSGDRYTIDAFTGATEQVLSEVVVDSNASRLFSMVKKYGNESASSGIGIYANRFSSLDALPVQAFGDGTAGNYIASSSVRAMAVSPDGEQLAVAGSDRSVRLYKVGQYEAPVQDVKLSLLARSMAFSSDGATLYVGGATITGQLVAMNASDLAERWQVQVFDTPTRLRATGDSGVVASLASGTAVLWIPDSADGKAVQIELADTVVAMDVTDSGDRIAVLDASQHLELINLHTAKRAQVEVSEDVKDVAFDEQSTAWVLAAENIRGFRVDPGFD